MNITEIIFRKTFTDGKLRAIASITIDGCFAIHEIKLIQTDHLFVAMPSARIPTESATTLRTQSEELHVMSLKAQSSMLTRNMWQLTKSPK